LSSAHPARPIDCTTPSTRQAAAVRAAVYSLPRSVWKITPVHVTAAGGGRHLQRCDDQGRIVVGGHGVAEHPAREQVLSGG
jgi:hypothetical protein